jgi:[acyl-carrier-protein] S-malonyltransferase
MSLALVFPGQGSQVIGMGKSLAAAFPAARAVFAEVDEVLGEKLSALIWAGPADALMLTENAQPGLLAASVAAFRVLVAERGFELPRDAAFVAGHSLGEYSALVAAESLTLADAARLLRIRGRAMQQAVPVGAGAMAALMGLDADQAQAVASQAAQGQVCEIANDNGAGQIVVSGDRAAVGRAIDIAQAHGARRAMMLPVSAPFHSLWMRPAADAMRQAFASILVRPPPIPWVCNVLARPITEPAEIVNRLVEGVVHTVRWRECVTFMAGAGVTTFYEVGAGRVLSGLIKRIVPTARTSTVGTPEEIGAVSSSNQ